MAYQLLGPIRVLGTSDASWQVNPFLLGTGWDVIIHAGVTVAQGAWPTQETFECYQISLDGPVGSQVQLFINSVPWNFVTQGWQNYDDMQQPMLLRNGDEVRFCWTTAFAAGPYTKSGGSNVQPDVTLWLRTEI